MTFTGEEFVPIKSGVTIPTTFAFVPSTTSRLPSGESDSYCALGIGTVAVIEADPRFRTSKSPGTFGLKTLVAMGTGTKTVLLSVQKTIFLAAPGRVIDPNGELELPLVVVWIASFALFTVATVWSVVLYTAVNCLLGLRAIIPGNVLEPDKLTLKKGPVSAWASMISSTGITPPVVLTCSGFETNARNVYPLPVFFAELLPQDTRSTLPTTSTAIPHKAFFKPGTPKSMKDRDLDAK
jgi:hypothetical protein